MDINWVPGDANTGIEMFCPKIHIKQCQWNPDWNEPFDNESNPKYDYISDYEAIFPHPINQCHIPQEIIQHWPNLQQAKSKGFGIPIETLAHFTNKGYAIAHTQGFKGGKKMINGQEGYFSWWSPIFEPEVNKQLRSHLGEVTIPFVGDNDPAGLQDQFATSPAFSRHTRYGYSYFQYSLQNLCQHYQDHIGGEELQFKVLGTFLYKQEIMHAVLVCSKTDGNDRFRKYPAVPPPDQDDNNEVVTRDDDDNWVWKPQATATEIKRLGGFGTYPKYRRWEHLAFAFYLQSKDDYIPAEDIFDHWYQYNAVENTWKKHNQPILQGQNPLEWTQICFYMIQPQLQAIVKTLVNIKLL